MGDSLGVCASAWSAAAQSKVMDPLEAVRQFVRANESADLESVMVTFDEGATSFDAAQPRFRRSQATRCRTCTEAVAGISKRQFFALRLEAIRRA